MNEFLICLFCGHAWMTLSWTKEDDCHHCGRSLDRAILVRAVDEDPEPARWFGNNARELMNLWPRWRKEQDR